MKNKKKIIMLSVVCILIAVISLIGITYAYYKIRYLSNLNEKSISVITDKIEIMYSDDNELITATDVRPGVFYEKSFTVTNTGYGIGYYIVTLVNRAEYTSPYREAWTYTLKQGDSIISEGIVPDEKEEMAISNNISIASGNTHSYVIELVYNDLEYDQTVDMGKEFAFKVDIKEANINLFEQAKEGTLLAAIRNNNKISIPNTIPGTDSAADGEALFTNVKYIKTTTLLNYETYDNYYYFRGKVDNNFLNFNEMCWRVVSIQPSGGVKIALDDYENECDTTNYTNGSNTSSFIGDILFNNSDKPTTDFSGSNIEAYLNQWLIQKKFDQSKLFVDLWCNESIINRIGARQAATFECDQNRRIVGKIGLLTADELAFSGYTVWYQNVLNNSYLTEKAQGDYWSLSEGKDSTQIYFATSGSTMGNRRSYTHTANVRPVLVLDGEILSSGTGLQTDPFVVD